MTLEIDLRDVLGNLPTNPNPPPEDDTQTREQFEVYMETARNRLVGITTRLTVGDLTPDEWLDLFEMELRYLFLVSAALGAGGFDGLTRDMVSLMESALREQFGYLNSWYAALTPDIRIPEDDIARLLRELGVSGLYDATEKQMLARAALYAESARATYFRVRGHALGLPPMPFYPGVRTICHVNCKCAWEYVKIAGNGNWDCYWRRSPVDSCATCLARERVAYPLKVRMGVIQPFDATGTMT